MSLPEIMAIRNGFRILIKIASVYSSSVMYGRHWGNLVSMVLLKVANAVVHLPRFYRKVSSIIVRFR